MNSNPKTTAAPVTTLASSPSSPATDKTTTVDQERPPPRSLLKRAADYLFLGFASSGNKKAKLSSPTVATDPVKNDEKDRVVVTADSNKSAAAVATAAADNSWISPLARDSNATRDSGNTFQNGDSSSAREAVNHRLSSQKEIVSNPLGDDDDADNEDFNCQPSSYSFSTKDAPSREDFPSFSIGSSSFASKSNLGRESTLTLNRRRIQFASSVKPAPEQGSTDRIRIGTPYHDGGRRRFRQQGTPASSRSFSSAMGGSLSSQRVRSVTFSTTPSSDPIRRRQYYKTPMKKIPLEQQYNVDDVAKENDPGVQKQAMSSSQKKQYKATSRILALPAGVSVSAPSPSSASKLSCISAQTISTVACKILEKQSSRFSPKTNVGDSSLFRDPTTTAVERGQGLSHGQQLNQVMGVKRVYGSHQTGSRVDSIAASVDSIGDGRGSGGDVGKYADEERIKQELTRDEELQSQSQQQHPIKRKRVTFTDTRLSDERVDDDTIEGREGQDVDKGRMPPESTPYKTLPEKVYVSIDNEVDFKRDDQGRTIYPPEYVYGVKMEIGSGSNGVVASDVTKKVLEKLKNGLLHGHVNFSKKKRTIHSPQRTDKSTESDSNASKLPYDFMPKVISNSRKGSSSILNKPPANDSSFTTKTTLNENAGGITEPSLPVASTDSTVLNNASSTNGWGNIFASEAGQWKCNVCCIKNKKEDSKCIACEAPKPSSDVENKASSQVSKFSSTAGATIAPKETKNNPFQTTSSNSMFTFGASNSTNKDGSGETSSAKFSFGVVTPSGTNVDRVVKPSTGGFVFGTDTSKRVNEKETESSAKGGFVFGFASKTDDKPVAGGITKDSASDEKGPSQPSVGSFSFGATMNVASTDSKDGKGIFKFGGLPKVASVSEIGSEKSFTGGFTCGSSTNAASPGNNEKGDKKKSAGGFVFGGKTDSGVASDKTQTLGAAAGFSFGTTTNNSTNNTVDKVSEKTNAASFSFGASTKSSASSDAKSVSQPSTGEFSFGAGAKQNAKGEESSSEPAPVSETKTFNTGFNSGGPSFPGTTEQKESASVGFGLTKDTEKSSNAEVKSEVTSKSEFTFGSVPPPQGGDTKNESVPKPQFSFGSTAAVPISSGKSTTDTAFGSSAAKPMFAFGSIPSTAKSGVENTFSFGQDSTSLTKRPIDDAISQPAPSTKFTFGSSSSSAPVSSGQSFAFGMNKDSGPSTMTENKPLFAFGASGTSTSVGAPAPSAGFTFGSSAPSASSTSTMETQAPPPSTGFSFGSTPAPSQGSTFTFGSAPAPATTAPSSSFSFGGNNAQTQPPAPFGAPSMPAPSTAGGFSFGQSQGTVAAAPFGQAPAPSTFGGFGTNAPATSAAPMAPSNFGAPSGPQNMMFGGAPVAGGGFAIGSGGGGNKNKAGRRIIRAKRPSAR
jgi:hypothetical protein